MCKGSGKSQPLSTGMASSWRINQYLMKQPCGYCKGRREVSDEDNPTQDQIDLHTKLRDGGR